jgi:hypothetical protein
LEFCELAQNSLDVNSHRREYEQILVRNGLMDLTVSSLNPAQNSASLVKTSRIGTA